jgi:hypothetical protein
MKKILFVVLIALHLLSKLSAQIACHDAIFISKNLIRNGKFKTDSNSLITLATILRNYLPPAIRDDSSLRSQAIIHFFIVRNENIFFKMVDSTIVNASQGGSPIAGLLKRAAGSVSSLDVTTIADGLAKFLVNRTKEELSVAFFVELKKDLNSYDELKILFPETLDILNLIDEKIYQFSAYLTELRDAFIIDLNNLPYHVPDILELQKFERHFSQERNDWIKPVLKSAFFIADALVKEDSVFRPGNFIDSLNKNVDHFFGLDGNPEKWDYFINGSIKTIHLVSASLRSRDTARYWINTDSLKLLVKDTVALKIYLGLIYAEAGDKNILFTQSRTLKSYLDTLAANYSRFVTPIQDSLIALGKKLKEADLNYRLIKDIKHNKTKDSLLRYSYALYISSLDVIEGGVGLLSPFVNVKNARVEDYIAVSKDMGTIYIEVRQKRYALAILSLADLLDILVKPYYADSSKKRSYVRLIRKLNTYGTFISNVAKADNSDEVADIIDKTVLPTGSSYVKKHSVFNISLNAYTGLYYGQQRQATDQKFVSVAGVYAPLGIAFSWGIARPDRKPPWSLSVFASIIDIGSIVSYRFTHYNDTIANDVHVRLGQIVSPGGHLVIGLPRWPLSIGGGFNWAPLITKVEKDEISIQPNNKMPLRWEIFAAVDIPLLHFYNKPR